MHVVSNRTWTLCWANLTPRQPINLNLRGDRVLDIRGADFVADDLIRQACHCDFTSHRSLKSVRCSLRSGRCKGTLWIYPWLIATLNRLPSSDNVATWPGKTSLTLAHCSYRDHVSLVLTVAEPTGGENSIHRPRTTLKIITASCRAID